MSVSATATPASPWADELVEIARAASGGLLFGLPLLFTEEVWWTGHGTEPAHQLAIMSVAFALVLVLNRTSGFRSRSDVTIREALGNTVEAVGIGLVMSLGMLTVLGEVNLGTPWELVLGKTVYEALPFALGISVANHFLRGGRDRPDRKATGGSSAGEEDTIRGTAADLGATIVGSLFVGITIAPTREVELIASRLEPVGLLTVIATSLVISYGIVFVAGFSGQESRVAQQGIFQHPITETVVCYLVSLVTALMLLWFFQRVSGPWPATLALVIVLGLPAVVGGAAGRLAI